ncbi:MAG: hypothetical protein IPH60_00045 [Flavobacteriales bacterium]|nr:hypothetical protein [Flavobacteriales bacterium]
MRSRRKAFEEDKQYDAIFNMKRLDVDPRYVVLCYKVQFRLPLLTRSIPERGENKYSFVGRGRHLLWALMCQAILNDKDLHSMAGAMVRTSLSVPTTCNTSAAWPPDNAVRC